MSEQWAKHRQCDREVQDLKDKPWKNEELRSLEEGLPKFGKGSEELQSSHGCGMSRISPKSSAGPAERNETGNCEIPGKKWNSV